MKANAQEIREKLHNGVVTFTFKKLNGKVRKAVGTLHDGILEGKMVGGPTGKSSPRVQVFYDLENEGWRSFSIGRELEILSFKAEK